MPCGMIYSNRFEAIEHLLTVHILCYEDFSLTCEAIPNNKDDTILFLETIFQQIKEVRKQLMSRLLFDEDIPEPPADPDFDLATLDVPQQIAE